MADRGGDIGRGLNSWEAIKEKVEAGFGNKYLSMHHITVSLPPSIVYLAQNTLVAPETKLPGSEEIFLKSN